ncbi:hypothetical protein BISA_0929 [Bifidobacterium saguini DSM 23967]|uniref:Uncharacterized protein n=2 Tax=Bifidobacterium saguini TaxID=762210 RepID=A0A087DAH6_9BIFI|nr:hypothetical protein BISA_0929 [Bifidobacterium saguini DSM 23967]
MKEYTLAAASALTGISSPALAKRIHRGRLKARKADGGQASRWLLDETTVKNLMQEERPWLGRDDASSAKPAPSEKDMKEIGCLRSRLDAIREQIELMEENLENIRLNEKLLVDLIAAKVQLAEINAARTSGRKSTVVQSGGPHGSRPVTRLGGDLEPRRFVSVSEASRWLREEDHKPQAVPSNISQAARKGLNAYGYQWTYEPEEEVSEQSQEDSD